MLVWSVLVWATVRVEVNVVGVHYDGQPFHAWHLLIDCSRPLIIVDKSPNIQNQASFQVVWLFSVYECVSLY